MAQNDSRGNLEISNMQLLFIRILILAQMEASVKWAQNFPFEVPPPILLKCTDVLKLFNVDEVCKKWHEKFVCVFIYLV